MVVKRQRRDSECSEFPDINRPIFNRHKICHAMFNSGNFTFAHCNGAMQAPLDSKAATNGSTYTVWRVGYVTNVSEF